MKYERNLPNLITCSRIAMSPFLFSFEPLSFGFYALYSICGLSDVLDGAIARCFDMKSPIGAKLDSIADLLFYSCMTLSLWDCLTATLPVELWWMLALILCLRAVSYVIAAVKYRKFSSVHSYLNKATGFCVFLIPYMCKFEFFCLYCFLVGFLAIVASCEEIFIHVKMGKYEEDRKTLFKP